MIGIHRHHYPLLSIARQFQVGKDTPEHFVDNELNILKNGGHIEAGGVPANQTVRFLKKIFVHSLQLPTDRYPIEPKNN